METKKRIRIVKDSSPANPWTDWDFEPPLMYDGGRDYEGDFSNGEIHEDVLNKITDGFIIRHQKELEEILEDVDLQDMKDREFSRDDKISDIRYYIGKANITELEKLCELLKIPHSTHSSRGYSQGDYAYVLIVLTDKFFKDTGCDRKNSEDILKGTRELFDAWAWGDVYGFIIEECKSYAKVPAEEFKYGSMDNVEFEEEWEEIDSCWGFYGDKWMENGMSDHIPEELHYQLENFDYNDIEY